MFSVLEWCVSPKQCVLVLWVSEGLSMSSLFFFSFCSDRALLSELSSSHLNVRASRDGKIPALEATPETQEVRGQRSWSEVGTGL